ncbi:hypothetical protein DDZ14_04470 [Maritimibacter sp. 55A14]|uniref:hypothetical protein n=1 Tax=Maritimibacter sp. 55A14 TaxID=2174844 RepID=UPI000D615EC9|nr:hypothetical protein [Maritimibacter sp. 55A14]PWE33457.1 hypothetical protein DDZ14_04470 [Maritimibacter sp. 55A14]
MNEQSGQSLTLTKTRIHAGIYEGVLADSSGGEGKPQVMVLHQSLPLDGLVLTEHPDRARCWYLSVPIPAEVLGDGVQTFLVKEETTGDTLDVFSIVTGAPLEDDIRAEVELLRAELDMLKSAFRRHCVETA